MSNAPVRTVKDLMSLDGKTALITGGGGHIGLAVAKAFAELGANIALLDIDGEAAQNNADEISTNFDTRPMVIELDIAKDEALRKVPTQVAAQFGGLDILVNNAAFAGDKNLSGWAVPFHQQSIESWRAAVDVNLTSVFSLCQASAELLSSSASQGCIINMASIYGVVAPDNSLYEGTNMGNPSAYGASKGGLIQFTRYLATELAPHVRANSISPGGLWRNQDERFVKRYEEKTPLGRMGVEEDLVGAAVFFASDLSAYITGQNLLVDGGWTAW